MGRSAKDILNKYLPGQDDEEEQTQEQLTTSFGEGTQSILDKYSVTNNDILNSSLNPIDNSWQEDAQIRRKRREAEMGITKELEPEKPQETPEQPDGADSVFGWMWHPDQTGTNAATGKRYNDGSDPKTSDPVSAYLDEQQAILDASKEARRKEAEENYEENRKPGIIDQFIDNILGKKEERESAWGPQGTTVNDTGSSHLSGNFAPTGRTAPEPRRAPENLPGLETTETPAMEEMTSSPYEALAKKEPETPRNYGTDDYLSEQQALMEANKPKEEETTNPDAGKSLDELRSEWYELRAKETMGQASDEEIARARELEQEIQTHDDLTDWFSKPPINDWEGRQELIDELNNLPFTAEGKARQAEIVAALREGDEKAGNPAMPYTGMERLESAVNAAGHGIEASAVNTAGTAAALANQNSSEYESTNPNNSRVTGVNAATGRTYSENDAVAAALDEQAALRAAEESRRRREAGERYNAEHTGLAEASGKLWETADALDEKSQKELAEAKAGLSKLGQAGVDLGENLLEMGFDAVVGSATGVGGLTSMGARLFGSATQEARQEGVDLTSQLTYGALETAKEIFTEKMFDGLAGIYGAGAADEIIEKFVGRMADTDLGRTLLRGVIGSGGEGLEEVASAYLDPLAKQFISNDSVGELYRQIDGDEVMYEFFMGAAAGLFGNAGTIVTGQDAAKNAELRAEENAPQYNPIEDTVTSAPQFTQATAPEATTQAETTPFEVAPALSNTPTETRADDTTAVESAPESGTVDQTSEAEPIQPETGTIEALTQEDRQALDDLARENGGLTTETAKDLGLDLSESEIQAYNDSLARDPAQAGGPATTDDELAIRIRATARALGVDGKINAEEVGHIVDAVHKLLADDHSMKVFRTMHGRRIADLVAARERALAMNQERDSKANTNPIVETVEGGETTTAPQETQATAGTTTEAETNPVADTVEESAVQPTRTDNHILEDILAATNTAPNTEVQDAIIGEEETTTAPTTSTVESTGGTTTTATPVSTKVEATGDIRERGLNENMRTSSTTEEDLARSLTNSPETYSQLSGREVVDRAKEIQSRGLDVALATVNGRIETAQNGGKGIDPVTVVLSRLVANDLAREGRVDEARRIIAAVASELTFYGQVNNAAKYLRGMDNASALAVIDAAIAKINKEYHKSHPRGRTGQWQASLTEAETDLIKSTDFSQDGALEAVWDTIAKRIGEEMPATASEVLREWRRVAMLARPRTQIRNVVANVPTLVARKAAEKLSAEFQKLLPADQRTRANGVDSETMKMAKDYYEANHEEIENGGNKFDMQDTLRAYRTYFGKRGNIAERVRALTYKCLERGDAPFVKSAYIDSLAQFCKAKGITNADDITAEARNFAFANAMEATYKAESALGNMLNSLKRKGGIAGKALDIVFPFVTTPLNITNLMLKYSPAGFVETIGKAMSGESGAAIADSAAKATVGTAIFGIGMLLRALGYITGSPDDDKDKAAFDKANGISPYAIGGKWTYNWAQPMGSMFALGADFWDALHNSDENIASAFVGAMYGAADSVLEMSLFQNVLKILKGYNSASQNAVEEIFQNSITQMVPGILTDLSKALGDPTIRSSFNAMDVTGVDLVDNTISTVMSLLPFAQKKLPASVNSMGEENHRAENLGLRVIDALINPGETNYNKPSDEAKELYKLYEETGDKNIFPDVAPYSIDGEMMSAQERAKYQTTMGTTLMKDLGELFGMDGWDSMTEAAKVKTIESLKGLSKDSAKREYAESKGEEYSSDLDDEQTLRDPAGYYAVKNSASTALKDGDYDVIDTLLGRDGMYSNLGEKAREMLDSGNTENLDKMYEAKQKGISPKLWQEAYEERKRIDKLEGKSKTEKAAMFQTWMRSRYTSDERDVLNEQLGFYSMIKAEPTRYNALVDAGMKDTTAEKVSSAMSGMTSNKEKISAVQGLNYLSDAEKWQVILEYCKNSKTAIESANKAKAAGVSYADWAKEWFATHK